MITQEYNLNLVPYAHEIVRGARFPVVTLSQYDSDSRNLIFHLFNLGEPYLIPENASGMVSGTKPDGTSVAYAVSIVDESTVALTLPEQASTVAGKFPAELTLFNSGGDRLGSANFIFAIEPTPTDAESIASETDIPVFSQYVAQAGAFAAQARQSASDASDSATEAQQSAENASASAEFAQQSAENASASADRAVLAEQNASASANTATAQAILAESWAVGGTGTRQFEDYDNAKFYAEQAKQGASDSGWVHFYIDDDGYLHYLRTPNTGITFYLSNGNLHARMEA